MVFMAVQGSDQKNVTTTCPVCGALAQNVMDGPEVSSQILYQECTACGCLMRKVAGDVAALDYLPKDKYLCRDTFLSFTAVKKLSELLAERNVCVVSSRKNAGFLSRMLIDNGYETITLRYLEKSSYLGVELGEFSYRPISAADRLAGRILVVLGTLSDLENPPAFFEALKKLEPSCIVALADIYQGQDSSWSVLQDAPPQGQIHYSHQALHQLACQIGYSMYSAENLYVLAKNPMDNSDNRLAKSLTSLQLYERNDFSDYLLSFRRKQIASENAVKVGQANPKKRIFFSKPQDKILYIDCVFFQMANSGIARVWNEVFRVWSRKHADKVVLLDRGGDIQDFGLPRIPFKRFDFTTPNAEIRALSWFLLRNGAYRFASTYYTFSELHPTKALIYDMIPENLSFDANDPQWVLKKMYLSRSEAAIAISRQTMTDMVKYFPALEGKTQFAYPGIAAEFQPLAEEQRREFRAKIGVTARYLFVVPCALGGYKDGITALQAIDRLNIAKDCEVICTVPLIGQEKAVESLSNIKVRSLRFSDQDYAHLVASADLVVWTPLMEGLGLPPMEAVTCHTNVVVARTGINLELYGDTVTYAEPRDVTSFSEAIASALTKGITNELIERVKLHSSIENFADRLFEFLYS